ncbi:hypothetical protein KCU64_g16627, partial [Aureobasidium melanogenum]
QISTTVGDHVGIPAAVCFTFLLPAQASEAPARYNATLSEDVRTALRTSNSWTLTLNTSTSVAL